jgi:hypothetical protein
LSQERIFLEVHRSWVEEALKSEENIRERRWSESIAVGSLLFIEQAKINLGAMGFGRKRMTPDDRICRYYYNPKHSTTPFRGDK